MGIPRPARWGLALAALAGLACDVAAGGERARAGPERWQEPTGNALVLVEGRLAREHGGVIQEIGCTAPGGPGRILDCAPDPAGLTFVAAENGLFVLGPYVDVLDPVPALEGAPSGRVRSLCVDAERRVWVATDDAVGALDPSFFWGRTLAADELPGQGPFRVACEGARVRIRGANGRRLHDPGAGPPPRLSGLRIDGEAMAPGARLACAPEATLLLEPGGEAAGGATFRYRYDGHHVWRELVPGVPIPAPRPGERLLEVVAVDQDLDRSEPFAVHLVVANPGHLDVRLLLIGTGVLLLVSLAAFLVGQWGVRGLRPGRALVSAGLVCVLALQVYAALVPHGRAWPFMGFNMYSHSYARDDVVYDERLVVLGPGWHEFVVRPESAGFTIDEPWEIYRPMIDRGAPAMSAFLQVLRERRPELPVRGLQVQARRSRLTEHGPVAIAPLVLAHYLVEAR